MKLVFLFTISVLFYSVSGAEPLPGNSGSGGSGLNLADHMLIQESKKFMNGESDEVIEGTPYLSETFDKGDIYSKKGKYAGVLMRYNIYTDYIEFKEKDVTYILDASPDIKKVDFGNLNLVVEKYDLKGKPKLGYFVLLDSGKVTLMSKKLVTFREKQEPKAIETEGTPAKYTRTSDEYFFKVGAGQLIKVASVKKMMESFPDKQEELKQFVSQEKISAKKEDELIKLVKYYNSL